jgi:hypothetical protein
MSKILRKNTRRLSAATLIASAVILLMFVFVDHSRSANPANGTLNPGGPDVPWVGTALGGSSPEGETTCVEGASCETFLLTLSGTPADWAGKKARVTISADVDGDDFDVYIHKGSTNTGPIVGSGAASGTPPEVVDLDPSLPSVGTGVFSVHIVYWLVVPGDQYKGVASVVGGAVPDPSPTPGGSPTPPPVAPGTPRFVNHYAPPGVMEDAGEPTNGVNWNTENVARGVANMFKNRFRDGRENQTFNGGTSLYYGGINSYFLRATFDDCSSPATVQWDQIPLVYANTTRAFYDPILFTDHITGRTFVCQEFGLTPAGSSVEFTDNDGEKMEFSEGAAPSGGVDHQTIGGGPFHAPAPPTVITPKNPPDPAATPYPHAVYYASQNVASATSQLSLDGGFSFPVQSPMFTASDCAGLHGHIKVAEDGTAFVPDKACSPAGVPFVFGGHPSVAVSEDNGATWTVRTVPSADSDAGKDDPSVGVSWCPPAKDANGADVACDKAERSKHIYLGFMYTNGRPGIAYSNNKGESWVRVTDLGALSGIKHIAFPMVAVGDPDRAAFAFLGTTTEGNYSAPEFPGIWHLYIATTFDSGVTWTVQNLSPEGPVQRGGVCGDGTCRNLLDFQDIQIDKQGRIVIAGQDGCVGGCEIGGSNSFTAKAYLSRQSGGKRMFSIYDAATVEPTLPGAPALSGSFDGTKVALNWAAPDDGGSFITAYHVYRAASETGPFNDAARIATVTQPAYIDTAPPAGDKFYVVTAVNAIGEGPFCKPFAPPTGPTASKCDLPGILVSNDLLQNGADNDSGANTPVDPRVNAKFLHVAEPFVSSGTEQIFFTLQVAPSTAGSAPPNSQWFIIWNRQTPDANHDRLYVAMRTDAAGTPSFEYGKFGVALDPTNPNPNANTPQSAGAADAGSSYDPATGVILIQISNSKLRAIDGGDAKYQPNSDLSALNVRTYFNRPDPGQRSQNNASDITPDGSAYTLVGNASCAPALAIPPANFINLSTRARVQTGDRVEIGGFIITGNAPKRVVIRAIGPSLTARGVANALQDPTLTLHDSNTNVITENDNWRDSQDRDAIQQSTLAPTDDRESAIIRTLDPGAYTAIVRGKNDQQGVGMVEIYDIDGAIDPRLGNLSTRAFVGEGDDVLIGGLIAGPSAGGNANGVIRALGPSLSARGVSGTLQDPTIEVFDANGNSTDFNDNWTDSNSRAAIESSGLAPSDAREAVVVGIFPPGNYTAIVRGKNETGVGLVEIYNPR